MAVIVWLLCLNLIQVEIPKSSASIFLGNIVAFFQMAYECNLRANLIKKDVPEKIDSTLDLRRSKERKLFFPAHNAESVKYGTF